MSARQVTFEERAQLDDLHRLVLDELCRRYPDKWEIVESVPTSVSRRQGAGKSKPGRDTSCQRR